MKPGLPCTYPGCHNTQPCAKHPRPRPFAHAARSTDAYSTPRWQEMKRNQLTVDPWCRMCKAEGSLTQATEVDHIIPHRGNIDLFFNELNLQSLCHVHHSRKTAREIAERNRPHG